MQTFRFTVDAEQAAGCGLGSGHESLNDGWLVPVVRHCEHKAIAPDAVPGGVERGAVPALPIGTVHVLDLYAQVPAVTETLLKPVSGVPCDHDHPLDPAVSHRPYAALNHGHAHEIAQGFMPIDIHTPVHTGACAGRENHCIHVCSLHRSHRPPGSGAQAHRLVVHHSYWPAARVESQLHVSKNARTLTRRTACADFRRPPAGFSVASVR